MSSAFRDRLCVKVLNIKSSKILTKKKQKISFKGATTFFFFFSKVILITVLNQNFKIIYVAFCPTWFIFLTCQAELPCCLNEGWPSTSVEAFHSVYIIKNISNSQIFFILFLTKVLSQSGIQTFNPLIKEHSKG